MNLLASTTWWTVLYTEDNDANTDNDDNTAWLHDLSCPLAYSVKHSGLYDSLKANDKQKDRQQFTVL